MKKIVSLLLAVCLILTAVPAQAIGFYAETSPATQTVATRYFYYQLSSRAKVFYDAMDEMYKNGQFMTGTALVELTDKIGGTALSEHMVGKANLLNDFGAARDAFWLDTPDIFYVDSSALSIRITQSGNDYHLYMGPGRYDTYYNPAFENEAEVKAAVEKYNAALDALVAKAANAADNEKKIEIIHDEIAKSVTYRDELTLLEMVGEGSRNPDSINLIRTSYGALVNHEGVCESYTRAFKSAMDRLGIPCVMVRGVYRHGENDIEEHIWNAVYLDSNVPAEAGVMTAAFGQSGWFAVDVTMDDPICKATQKTSTGLDGYESHEYLLAGDSKMLAHHVVTPVVSESGFEFSFPMMNYESAKSTVITDENSPLQVRYTVGSAYGEQDAGIYYVSYMGMNLNEMIAAGYYLLMKYTVYDVIYGWQETDWGYVTPELFMFPNEGHETRFDMPHVEYVEFGVTETPYPAITGNSIPDLFYHGDPKLLLADSGMVHNEYGTYRAAPHVRKAEPTQTKTWEIDGSWKHVTAEYDDILVLQDVYDKYCATENYQAPEYRSEIQKVTAKDIKLRVLVTDYGVGIESGIRTQDYAYLTRNLNIHHVIPEEGKPYSIVEFDFCPSEMWADDNVFYSFYVEGVVGAWSGKAPGYFGYGCAHPCAICCWRSRGFDYNCFGKPQILSDGDLSVGDFVENAAGTPFEENLKSRLMLVVEDANKKDDHVMNELVGEKMNENVLSSSSYHINLTLCRKWMSNLKDGMSIRLSCGFPVGYGPEDAGVTFKAYHYIKDSEGNITGIEEIPCTVTPYGLLIEVKSFSPFLIAAVEDDGSETDTSKTVLLVADQGGSISGTGAVNGTVKLEPGKSVAVTVTADEGYTVDTVEASGVSKAIENKESFEIKYEDIEGTSSIVSAKFISAKVAEQEVGETVIPVAVAPDPFSIQGGSQYEEGATAILSVIAPNDAYTYQWYKVNGNVATDSTVGTGSSLSITGLSVTDSGSYYCIAIATAGVTMEETKSTDSVTFTVTPAATVHDTHTYGEYTSAGPEGHYQQCTHFYPDGSRCENKTVTVPHTYNSEGVCEYCSYRDDSEHVHVFSEKFEYDDASGHFRRCVYVMSDGTLCGEKDEVVPHDDQGSDHSCSVCGYKELSPVHTWGDEYVGDEFGHYKTCLGCGSHSALEKHEFDPEGVCTVCGYYSFDAHTHIPGNTYFADGMNGHYHICAYANEGVSCAYQFETEPHRFNAFGVCSDCQYVNETLHQHTYIESDWYIGENGHYRICTFVYNDGTRCEEKEPETPHTFVDGVCSACGYVDRTSDVPVVPSVTKGDVNGDGRISSIDAVLILRYLAKLPNDVFDADAADVNDSGDISSLDAVLILRKLANLD